MGRFEMEDIMASPGLDNLHIIEAGPIPANPSELLSTAAMRDFLQAVSAEYDIVLIDTPPILPVTDSAIVAGQVDGVLLVYQAGKVGRLVLKRAKAHLESARAKVWGIVLNDLQTEISGYTYTHYYTHYYGEETGGDTTPRGPMQRALTFIKGKLGFGGGGSGNAAAAVMPAGTPTSGTPAFSAPPLRPIDVVPMTDLESHVETLSPTAVSSRRRLSKRAVGVGVLVVVGVTVGLVAWRFGIPGTGNPRAQLRQRLDTPTAPKSTSRPAPAEPVTTIRPAAPPLSTPPAPPIAPPSNIVPPMTAPPAVRPLVETLAPPVTALLTPPRPAIDASPSVALPSVMAPPPASRSMSASLSAPALALTPPPAPLMLAPAPVKEPSRFALLFGPFTSPAEAEKLERILIKAGHDTLRTRQGAGPTVYAVLIDRVATPHDARTIISVLREQAIGEATIVSTQPVVVRVGELHPLRGAVALAERVRKAGYKVRVAAQSTDKAEYVIRHGSFASREEAEARSRDLARLSVPAAQVVPVR